MVEPSKVHRINLPEYLEETKLDEQNYNNVSETTHKQ